MPRYWRARLSQIEPMTSLRARSYLPTAIIVDDDPMVLDVLSLMLEDLEWVVTTASNAEEVLASNALPAPRVLITDVNLGAGMDGFALRTIARERWPEIGIVVISGRPAHPQLLEALSSRDIFISKPVSIAALNTAIARVCGYTNGLERPAHWPAAADTGGAMSAQDRDVTRRAK